MAAAGGHWVKGSFQPASGGAGGASVDAVIGDMSVKEMGLLQNLPDEDRLAGQIRRNTRGFSEGAMEDLYRHRLIERVSGTGDEAVIRLSDRGRGVRQELITRRNQDLAGLVYTGRTR